MPNKLVFLPVASAIASAQNGILRIACNAVSPDLQQFLLSQEKDYDTDYYLNSFYLGRREGENAAWIQLFRLSQQFLEIWEFVYYLYTQICIPP